jgi:hypothetical protein
MTISMGCRRGRLVLTFATLAASALAAGCGGVQVPQHSGYKGKTTKPWEKAKEIKLGGDFTGKVSSDLDYASYKRARWYYVQLPGPGNLAIDMEVVPAGQASGGEGDEEGEDLDVAIELLDPSFNVIAKSDLETEDAHSLKKTLEKKQLEAARYLVHVYLQGRMDAADVELKVAFTRGEAVWKSDFPNQVDFPSALPAVPPFDDAPQKKDTKPVRRGGGTTTRVRPPEPDPVPKPTGGGGLVQVGLTDTQPDGSGNVRIVIGAGTSDGLADGLSGSVVGVPRATFKTTGCTGSTCKGTVRASIDDVRNSGQVTIRLK